MRRSPCQRVTTVRRSAVVLASIAVKGSSSRMTGQSCNNIRANSTRWNWPADRESMAAGRTIETDGQRFLGFAPEGARDRTE